MKQFIEPELKVTKFECENLMDIVNPDYSVPETEEEVISLWSE